jgi:hypothetical protein
VNANDLTIPNSLLADPSLRPTAKLIFARLMKDAGGGKLVFISRFALAGDLGLSVQATQRALAALEVAGWIVRAVSDYAPGLPRGYRVLTGDLRDAHLGAVAPSNVTKASPRRLNQLNLFDTSIEKKESSPSPRSARI